LWRQKGGGVATHTSLVTELPHASLAHWRTAAVTAVVITALCRYGAGHSVSDSNLAPALIPPLV